MRASVRGSRPGCPSQLHDSYNARKNGCTCPAAVEAARLYQKRRSTGRHTPNLVPVLGTQRRIQALAAMGYSLKFQALELGWVGGGKLNVLKQRKGTVHVETAERVKAMYDRLCMTPGPSERARGHARRQGWASPLAWDDIDDPNEHPVVSVHVNIVPHSRLDEVVIEQAVAGWKPRMSTAEKDAAVDQLDTKGLSSADIAERIGITQRSVVRIRARIRDTDMQEAV